MFASVDGGMSYADDVMRQAEADQAPFTRSGELKAWVAKALDELA